VEIGIALALRTIVVEESWRLEVASFAAALLVGIVVQLLHCIPMIPRGLAAKALLGLFVVTGPGFASDKALIATIWNSLHVVFTIGALGTGLGIPILLLHFQLNQNRTAEPYR
jgi:uncharacterized membrane protein YjjB (DUF3815 family)